MSDIAFQQPGITAAYIHIPFCSHKCEFCDFAAFAGLDHLEDEYTEIVCKEIRERVALVTSPIRLKSIFFGGGTPGLVAPENLARIVDTLAKVAHIEGNIEFSLETTPHSITTKKLEAWRKLGINRISIGIESLQDAELKAIGRDHTIAQALRGLELSAPFCDNINVDFMYGLPTQTLESWRDTLNQFVALTKVYKQIKHVSSYCLELAVNSPLLSKFPRISPAYPEEDSLAAFFELMLETLVNAGFQHYEVSNFARPGYASEHNLVYWRNMPYLAFGVGAHRYVDGYRSANFRSLKRYMREYMGDEMRELIDRGTQIKEAVMLGLRMRAGIDVKVFEDAYGVNLAADFAGPIEKLKSGGFIEFDGRQLRISDSGVLMSNSIIAEFI